MQPSYSVPTAAAKNIISVAVSRTRGIDLCEAANLDPSRIDDPTVRIPLMKLVELYECAARMGKDDFFGLRVGATFDHRLFGLYHYVVRNSPNIGEALRRIGRYSSLWTQGVEFRVETENSAARFILQYKDPFVMDTRQHSEAVLLAIFRLCRAVASRGLTAREVRFCHAVPKDISQHKRLFEAPIHFRMPNNELIFDRDVLQYPLHSADTQLGEVLVQHAEHLLTTIPQEDLLLFRAESALCRAMRNGRIGLHAISESLGMSTRSLQRALKNDGITYQGLLSNIRRELSQEYLLHSQKRVSEIAYLLGYSHPSEFSRVFRAWTGMAPKEYRRLMTKLRKEGARRVSGERLSAHPKYVTLGNPLSQFIPIGCQPCPNLPE